MSTTRLAFQQQSVGFRRLPSQIQIDYGPPALFGRAVLKADQAARRRGVYLSLASCQDLVSVNEANSKSWTPLAPIFNPALGGNTESDSFAIVGHNLDGDVVAAQAARYFDWRKSDFHEEAESLRLFYADPDQARNRGERCSVTSIQARNVKGRVVYSGGGWYRPDYRKRMLGAILPRVSRILSSTRWQQDFTISMMADPVYRGGFAARAGYTYAEPGVNMIDTIAGPGLVHFSLIWMDAAQLLSDIEWFVGGFDEDGAKPAEVEQVDERRWASI